MIDPLQLLSCPTITLGGQLADAWSGPLRVGIVCDEVGAIRLKAGAGGRPLTVPVEPQHPNCGLLAVRVHGQDGVRTIVPYSLVRAGEVGTTILRRGRERLTEQPALLKVEVDLPRCSGFELPCASELEIVAATEADSQRGGPCCWTSMLVAVPPKRRIIFCCVQQTGMAKWAVTTNDVGWVELQLVQ